MKETKNVQADTVSAKRAYGLDLARILAAYFIFTFHSWMKARCKFNGPFQYFIRVGAVFMVVFFVLSGMVLYKNYRNKDLNELGSMMRFYLKRLITLYPLYLFCYVMFLLFFSSTPPNENALLAPIQLSMIQMIFDRAFDLANNQEVWFVSCMMFCYASFPFVLNIVKQIKTRGKIICLTFLLFYNIWIPIVTNVFPLNDIYPSVFLRMSEFIIGILLAALLEERKKIFQIGNAMGHPISLCIVSITIFFSIAYISEKEMIPVDRLMSYSAVALPLFILWLIGLMNMNWPFVEKILSTKMVQYLSSISYAFFFSQMFAWKIVLYIDEKYDLTKRQRYEYSLIICLILAALMHEIIEKPVKKTFQKL